MKDMVVEVYRRAKQLYKTGQDHSIYKEFPKGIAFSHSKCNVLKFRGR